MRHSEFQQKALMHGVSLSETEAQALVPAGLGYMGDIASTFNANAVWADVQEGGKAGKYQQELALYECEKIPQACASKQAQIANANFRGNRGANAIRDGLRALGYEPGNNNTGWSSEDMTAWEAFTGENNLPSGPGLVNKVGLDKMQELLQGGPVTTTIAKVSKGGWLPWIIAGAVAAAAAVALGG